MVAAQAAGPDAGQKPRSGARPVLPGGNTKAPITIDASKLEYFDKDQKLIYSGGVVATQGESKMRATTMVIFLARSDEPATLQSATGGAKLGALERIEEDGEVTYDTTFASKNGGERSISVAQDGSLLSLEVTLADLPPAVKKTIAEQTGDRKVTAITKETDTDGTTYDVTVTNPAGAERSLAIGEDGTLISREVSLEETPAGVQITIKARAGDGTIASISQAFDEGETSFDITYTTKQGKELSFSVSPSGRLNSVEISLDDAPAPVQATIKDKVGGGKVLRVNKIFNPRQKVQGYEIESVVNGKPFDFEVSPKGKFSRADQ